MLSNEYVQVTSGCKDLLQVTVNDRTVPVNNATTTQMFVSLCVSD